MTTDKKIEPQEVVELHLKYNLLTGGFEMSGNVRDEIITVGMLHTALDRMKENYNLARALAMKEQAENGLVSPHGPVLKVQ